MNRTTTLFALSALSALLGLATGEASAAPRFDDFPAPPSYAGKPAPVRVQVRGADSRMYATRLRLGARQPVNFAGRHILTMWGCGASCLMGAVIDSKTGVVTWLPHTVCCWNDDVQEPVEYRRESRLLILHGSLDEQGAGSAVHYYEFNGRRFVPIPVPVPAPR